MDEEEVARLVRTRAHGWRGSRPRAEQGRWATTPVRRRWRWLPAATALGAAAMVSAGAAVYAAGPAPMRGVLAPVGDRVTHPSQAEPAERRPQAEPDTKLIAPSSMAVSPESTIEPGEGPRAIASPRSDASERPKQDHASRTGRESPKSSPSPTHAPEHDD